MTEEEIAKWIERYNQEFIDFLTQLTVQEKMVALKLFCKILEGMQIER